MPKKPNLNDLMKSVPSPMTTHTKFLTILFALLIFSTLLYLGSVTYTGLAISELNQENSLIKNQNILVSNRFEILEIQKTPNSVLDVKLDSDVSLNIFAEIDDCSYWKNGNDRDNTVLYALNGVKQGDFKIGNPSDNLIQSLDLYKADDFCLIFINREFPISGNANIKYQETYVDKWRIV